MDAVDSLVLHARSRVVSCCGKLARSVRKFCRGDKGETSWETEFEARILGDIRELTLFLLLGLASANATATLGEAMTSAMQSNMVKIERRYKAGAICGDGDGR